MSDSSSNSPPTPSLFGRIWPTIAYVLLALGLPSALITYFYHDVIAHPWFTLLLVVTYEVVSFILSIAGKVWQKLESRWVDRIAEWLDTWVLGMVSRYRKQYCQYLIYQ